MFRSARRTSLVLAAGLVGALLGAAPAHAAGTYSLVVLPDQGEQQIYDFIGSATKTIDMTMYELRDTTVENDLIAKQKAGVKVRVILDGQRTTVNNTAYTALQNGGVAVTWSSSAYVYTHQKTITVDGAKSYVSTGNLDSTYYSTSRDFGVFDTNASDVSAIEAVFNADFAKTAITPSDGADLVWSPTDSQTQLTNLINSAQHSLEVEQEEFQDTALVNAVVAAAQRGVHVRVVAEDQGGKYDTELNQVTAAGGQVKTYSSSTGYYIHAKTIVVDYGTAAARVFQGSENFSDNSLNHNRELGLIVADSGVLTGIENGFNADFGSSGGGGTGSVTVTNPGAQTATAGTATSLQIQAADTAGGTLSYSATGLPAGLTINATTGLISGTPSTAGSYSVTVTAKDSSGPSGSATFTWTVSTTSGCSSRQLLGNAGFESGTAAPWSTSSSVIYSGDAEPARTGSWDAWLDGYGATHTDTLSQGVTLPSGCTSYAFTFYMHVDTAETSTTTKYDTLKLQLLNSAGTVLANLYTYSNLNANTGYSQHSFNLSSYAGQAVTLKFTGAEDSSMQTSFVLDDTALTVS